MNDIDRPTWIVIAIIVGLLVMRGPGCTLSQSSPPYPSPEKVTAMISADLSIQGDQALDTTHPGVLAAVEKWIVDHKGEYRLDDTNTKDSLLEVAWAEAAIKVADRAHPPTIVAAGPKRGIKPQPLPTQPAVATKLLDSLLP